MGHTGLPLERGSLLLACYATPMTRAGRVVVDSTIPASPSLLRLASTRPGAPRDGPDKEPRPSRRQQRYLEQEADTPFRYPGRPDACHAKHGAQRSGASSLAEVALQAMRAARLLHSPVDARPAGVISWARAASTVVGRAGWPVETSTGRLRRSALVDGSVTGTFHGRSAELFVEELHPRRSKFRLRIDGRVDVHRRACKEIA
jgi:hypothetical protein